MIGDYTAIEYSKRKYRPELMKAIARCKIEGAVLVTAKLDRLSRNVAFVYEDIPEMNTFTIEGKGST